jgi:hypothetical protein
VEEWRSGGVEEWRSGGVEEWRSGGVEEWRSGGVEEWRSGGGRAKLQPGPTLAHLTRSNHGSSRRRPSACPLRVASLASWHHTRYRSPSKGVPTPRDLGDRRLPPRAATPSVRPIDPCGLRVNPKSLRIRSARPPAWRRRRRPPRPARPPLPPPQPRRARRPQQPAAPSRPSWPARPPGTRPTAPGTPQLQRPRTARRSRPRRPPRPTRAPPRCCTCCTPTAPQRGWRCSDGRARSRTRCRRRQ